MATPQTMSVRGAHHGAWEAFRRATGSPGYRDHLAAHGVDPDAVDRWESLPFIDKATVYGEDVARWTTTGDLTTAAEIVCSSGQSGQAVSVGLASAAQKAALVDRVDAALVAMGGGPDSPSLLVNLLPMGISVPSALAADPAGAACAPWLHLTDGLHVPALLTYDPGRVLVEERPMDDGSSRLVATDLADGPLPLVRYDLGDLGRVLRDDEVAALAAVLGAPLEGPVVAVAGRGRHLEVGGRRVTPEGVKEAIFGIPALAAACSGRFRLETAGRGMVCHLQARADQLDAAVTRGLEALSRTLSSWIDAPVHTVWHSPRDYPFHAAGDWTRKAVYLENPS